MNHYKITYDLCGGAMLFECLAESEGEAIEKFDAFTDRLDDYAELISIVEVAK